VKVTGSERKKIEHLLENEVIQRMMINKEGKKWGLFLNEENKLVSGDRIITLAAS